MSLTRPFKKGLLRVETELKLLNIDLVIIYFLILKKKKILNLYY